VTSVTEAPLRLLEGVLGSVDSPSRSPDAVELPERPIRVPQTLAASSGAGFTHAPWNGPSLPCRTLRRWPCGRGAGGGRGQQFAVVSIVWLSVTHALELSTPACGVSHKGLDQRYARATATPGVRAPGPEQHPNRCRRPSLKKWTRRPVTAAASRAVIASADSRAGRERPASGSAALLGRAVSRVPERPACSAATGGPSAALLGRGVSRAVRA